MLTDVELLVLGLGVEGGSARLVGGPRHFEGDADGDLSDVLETRVDTTLGETLLGHGRGDDLRLPLEEEEASLGRRAGRASCRCDALGRGSLPGPLRGRCRRCSPAPAHRSSSAPGSG